MPLHNGPLLAEKRRLLRSGYNFRSDSERTVTTIMRTTSVSFLLLVLSVQSIEAQEMDQWETAVHEIVRLDPADCDVLPTQVRAYLIERGCTVPQTPHRGSPHNMAKGNLDDSELPDWVVLCSIERQSAIFVFWDGSAKDVAQISPWTDDIDWLQTGHDSIEFSRIVNIASPEQIIRYSASYNVDVPITPTHAGVDDGFDGKGSVVHYWSGQKWLQLQGAD